MIWWPISWQIQLLISFTKMLQSKNDKRTANVRGDLDSRIVSQNWRDNKEQSRSAEEKVIGSEEDIEETHDKEEEDQEDLQTADI